MSLGFQEKQVGYCFGLNGVAFGLGPLAASQCCQHFDKRYIVQFGSVAVILSLLLQGPSQMLGYQASSTPMLISFVLVGFFFPFMNMPFIPILVEAIELEQRKKNERTC